MREKRYRLLSVLMAFVMVFTTLLSVNVGQMVVKADVMPESVSISGYDLWADGAKWASAPMDGNWNLTPDNKVYDYAENDQNVDTSLLPDTSTAGIKFGDNGGGSTYQYYETVAVLPAGTYTLSTMLMGKDAHLTLFIGDMRADSTCDATKWNAWISANEKFTVTETQENVKIGFYLDVDASGWGYIDQLYIQGSSEDAGNEEGYKVTITPDVDSVEVGNLITLTAKVTKNGEEITDLQSAGLHLYWWNNTIGNNGGDGDIWFVNADKSTDNVLALQMKPETAGTYEIQARLQEVLQDNTWVDLAIQKCVINVTEASTAIEGDLDVTKVSNLPDDFIMGMDISSVIAEFDSGVTFKDYDGNTINNVTDFCVFLASNGITHIRVRVWNNPYDANGNGYGGGNNDVEKAKQIADGCRAAGIKVLVDFHCSDLWTDPGKQMAPKAWKDYTLEQKASSLSEFLTSSLNTIDPNGDTVAMVQVGNETTSGFIGETDVASMCRLFSAGVDAVHTYNSSVKAVIHVTNPEAGNVTKWAKNLSDNNVNYDILATSYYPYWHGTLANLKSEFNTVRNTYGKDVMVAETSYAYTLNDTDGHDNTVRVGNNDTGGYCTEPFSVQGQATSIRNLINAVNEAGGLGVFYWEPAWITVGDTTGLDGGVLADQIASNRAKWEQFGSGWASSYASEYDADDAGKWYGGSAVDNEAMFYPDGTPTAGLKVWNYVKTGAVSNKISVEEIENVELTIFEGGTYTLPATVKVSYNKGVVDESVIWDESDVASINPSKTGTYVVNGKVTFSKTVDDGEYAGMAEAPVTYQITVKPQNLITDAQDAGFEKGDNFTVGGSGISSIPSKDDPYAGAGSMHWYNATASEGTVTYNPVITLEAGEYVFEAVAQGFAGDTVCVQILDDKEQVLFEGEKVTLAGWKNWMIPKVSFALTEAAEIKLRVIVNMQATGWGTADELYLYQKTIQENVSVLEIEKAEQTIKAGEAYTLPETLKVTYNEDVVDEKVVWNESDLASIKASEPGTYIVNGKVTFSRTVNEGDYAGKTEADVTYQLTVQEAEDTGSGEDTPKVSVLEIEKAEQTIKAGEAYTLPETLKVTYNEDVVDEKVVWNESDLASIEASEPGTYTVNGKVTFSRTVNEGDYAGKTEADVTYQLTVQEAEDTGSGEDTPKVSVLEIEKAEQTIKAGEAYTLPETLKVTYNDDAVNEQVTWNESDVASIKVSEPGTYVVHGTVAFSKKVNDGDYAGKAGADVTYQLTVQKPEPGTGTDTDTNTGTSSGDNSSSTPTTPQPENVTVTVKPDGSIIETKKETETNQSGNTVAVTTTTEKAPDGNVVSMTETSVITNADSGTSATVTVATDVKGTVTASAEVTKTGTKTASGRTDGTITTTVMKQITEAAGTSNVRFRQTVLNADGSTRFTVEADMRDLAEGKALTIMKLDPKTGDYYLCNQRDYMVTESGVSLIIKTAGSFILLNEEDAKAASDAIIETLKPKKSSVTVKVGKTTTAALSSAFNMKNVSKITYTTSNKSVAAVNKKGKVTAKKSGTVTIKAKVVLKNGVTKTITMKVKVNK